MTAAQREKLWYLAGMVEGIAWAVEDPHLNEGLGEVVESIGELLIQDIGKDEEPDG